MPAKKKKAKKKVAKRKTKKVVKRKTKKAGKKKVKKKRKLNPAFMKTLNASDKLVQVIGSRNKKVTRQKAIKLFWDYVKSEDLQDSKDRRNINLDSTLKKLFGNKRQVTMFEVTKVISKNLS